jgi:succinate dehydrogenase / fumarate reductase cytochrome b subunit
MAHAEFGGGLKHARPLSPHLQIYTPLINMVMSIAHRFTGAVLYFGTLILAWWLIAAASGKAYYDFVNGLFGASFYGVPFGRIVLFGYTWALIHHMLGGIRHFIWDTGRGFALSTVNALCWATIVLSIGLTLAVWAFAWQLRGGL